VTKAWCEIDKTVAPRTIVTLEGYEADGGAPVREPRRRPPPNLIGTTSVAEIRQAVKRAKEQVEEEVIATESVAVS
jgi:hypothetical protein